MIRTRLAGATLPAQGKTLSAISNIENHDWLITVESHDWLITVESHAYWVQCKFCWYRAGTMPPASYHTCPMSLRPRWSASMPAKLRRSKIDSPASRCNMEGIASGPPKCLPCTTSSDIRLTVEVVSIARLPVHAGISSYCGTQCRPRRSVCKRRVPDYPW